MNLAKLINTITFKSMLIFKSMFYIKPMLNITLSVLYFLTKSLTYILELLIYINYLQNNVFQIVVINKKFVYFENHY